MPKRLCGSINREPSASKWLKCNVLLPATRSCFSTGSPHCRRESRRRSPPGMDGPPFSSDCSTTKSHVAVKHWYYGTETSPSGHRFVHHATQSAPHRGTSVSSRASPTSEPIDLHMCSSQPSWPVVGSCRTGTFAEFDHLDSVLEGGRHEISTTVTSENSISNSEGLLDRAGPALTSS